MMGTAFVLQSSCITFGRIALNFQNSIIGLWLPGCRAQLSFPIYSFDQAEVRFVTFWYFMGSFLDLTPLNFRISKRVLFSIEVKVVHFGQLLLLLLKQFSFF